MEEDAKTLDERIEHERLNFNGSDCQKEHCAVCANNFSNREITDRFNKKGRIYPNNEIFYAST